MNHFQNYLVEEFAEDYQEGRISRRQALKLIASVAGSVLLANTLLSACAPENLGITPTEPGAAAIELSTATPATNTATPPGNETTEPAELAITATEVKIPAGNETLIGYLAYPQSGGPYPVILVCHENRGLTPHIQDVTRRLARAGYAALAVDLLSRQGGSASLRTDQIPGILGNIQPDQFAQDFQSGYNYMLTQPFVEPGRVGMVGFCFGGGVTWLVATRMPELKAAVPFYGPHPPVEDIPKITAAVLAIYAERDQRINQGIPAIEEAMQLNNKIYEKVIYPDSDHAFHNDTGSRYNPEAARDAWQRTLAWFDRYV